MDLNFGSIRDYLDVFETIWNDSDAREVHFVINIGRIGSYVCHNLLEKRHKSVQQAAKKRQDFSQKSFYYELEKIPSMPRPRCLLQDGTYITEQAKKGAKKRQKADQKQKKTGKIEVNKVLLIWNNTHYASSALFASSLKGRKAIEIRLKLV